jgi:hypothetical protein
MEEMTVQAEARPEHWDGSGLHAHAEKVSVFIKNTIGITARIKVVAPDTLERSLAKRNGFTTGGRKGNSCLSGQMRQREYP